jgi:hypothetical protein
MSMAQEQEHDTDLPKSTDHVQVMYPSKYLKKEDLRGKDVTLTIDKVTLRNVRMTNGVRERKVICHFQEMDGRPEGERKVWVLSKTNAVTIAEIHSETNPHQWPGLKVTLYHEPEVMFGGKRVGGIRVRPKKP